MWMGMMGVLCGLGGEPPIILMFSRRKEGSWGIFSKGGRNFRGCQVPTPASAGWWCARDFSYDRWWQVGGGKMNLRFLIGSLKDFSWGVHEIPHGESVRFVTERPSDSQRTSPRIPKGLLREFLKTSSEIQNFQRTPLLRIPEEPL